jgi:hypothetical protein
MINRTEELERVLLNYIRAVDHWMQERPDDEQGTTSQWNKFQKIEDELASVREQAEALLKTDVAIR